MSVTVDTSALNRLPAELAGSLDILGEQLAVRGHLLMREAVPKRSGKLSQGAFGEYKKSTREILIGVETNSARPARTATLHLASGKTRPVTLRATANYNPAAGVDLGTGVYGPTGQVIRPKTARVLLIGVKDVPLGESYIDDAGQKFIMRPQTQGQKGQHFSDKASEALLAELPALWQESATKGGV